MQRCTYRACSWGYILKYFWMVLKGFIRRKIKDKSSWQFSPRNWMDIIHIRNWWQFAMLWIFSLFTWKHSKICHKKHNKKNWFLMRNFISCFIEQLSSTFSNWEKHHIWSVLPTISMEDTSYEAASSQEWLFHSNIWVVFGCTTFYGTTSDNTYCTMFGLQN